MVSKQNRELREHIKPVKYFCFYNNNLGDKDELPTFSFTPPPQKNNQQILEININPSKIPSDKNSSLVTTRNKWFKNLSNVDIPFNVQCLLQLGQNFSLPAFNTKNNIIEMIKNIENNIKKLNLDIQSNIRNHSLQIIKKLFNKCTQTKKIYQRMSCLMKSTK